MGTVTGITELTYGVKYRVNGGEITVKRFNTSDGRTRWIAKQGAGFTLISFINP